jgi:hypothetical protein
MVHAEFWRPGSEIGRSECIATLTQRGHSQPQIEGREPQVVNLERLVLSVSTGEAIRWEDDPEERARSLTGSHRSPYLLAEIAHDDNPDRSETGQQDADERLVVRQRHRRSWRRFDRVHDPANSLGP